MKKKKSCSLIDEATCILKFENVNFITNWKKSYFWQINNKWQATKFSWPINQFTLTKSIWHCYNLLPANVKVRKPQHQYSPSCRLLQAAPQAHVYRGRQEDAHLRVQVHDEGPAVRGEEDLVRRHPPRIRPRGRTHAWWVSLLNTWQCRASALLCSALSVTTIQR